MDSCGFFHPAETCHCLLQRSWDLGKRAVDLDLQVRICSKNLWLHEEDLGISGVQAPDRLWWSMTQGPSLTQFTTTIWRHEKFRSLVIAHFSECMWGSERQHHTLWWWANRQEGNTLHMLLVHTNPTPPYESYMNWLMHNFLLGGRFGWVHLGESTQTPGEHQVPSFWNLSERYIYIYT